MRNITQSTCCVIPPHIQNHVAQHGNSKQRERAAATLAHTVAQRSCEQAAALIGPRVQRPLEKKRHIYHAGGQLTLPGTLVMTEERTTASDIEMREAFDGSGAVYDFLGSVFLRHSIDNRGMRLDSTVHYGTHFENAFWNGRQMVYGDGDGQLYNRFTAPVDVVAHEHIHGMTEHDAGLLYCGQPGALNEHISDVIGILTKQWRLGLTAMRSDWVIGREVFGPAVRGVGLRSMKAPGTAYDDPVLGKDPQPSHMRRYMDFPDDDGGVHINSGILNRAFYFTAADLRGYAWEIGGRIWYRTATSRLHPEADFQYFAEATVTVAGEMYGIGGNVQRVIFDAFSRVGLSLPASLLRSAGFGRKALLPEGSSAKE
ncbi:MAG TPA: M4 family metallopeptidase [Thermoanaerobaculia bacterium]|nr:M4 family metallopeptidase [Thermoanaerobaculia bacterium]